MSKAQPVVCREKLRVASMLRRGEHALVADVAHRARHDERAGVRDRAAPRADDLEDPQRLGAQRAIQPRRLVQRAAASSPIVRSIAHAGAGQAAGVEAGELARRRGRGRRANGSANGACGPDGCSTSSADALRPWSSAAAREAGGVLAVQAHDLLGRHDPPEVGRGVVAEPREDAPRPRVAQRRGVEEELRVGDVRLAVGGERALHVADAHVVAGDGEVVAAQALARRSAGSARSRRSPWPGRSARRRGGAARRRAATCRAARDAAGQALAAAHVDAHPEEVLAGLGEDLRQADRAVEVVRGLGVRPAGALEHDDAPRGRRGRGASVFATRSTSGRNVAVRDADSTTPPGLLA